MTTTVADLKVRYDELRTKYGQYGQKTQQLAYTCCTRYGFDPEIEYPSEKVAKLEVKMIKVGNCPRCAGTGKVAFNYADGVCFKCNGSGSF